MLLINLVWLKIRPAQWDVLMSQCRETIAALLKPLGIFIWNCVWGSYLLFFTLRQNWHDKTADWSRGKVRDWIGNGGGTDVAHTCFPSLPLLLETDTSYQNVNCSGCKSICLWATTWTCTGFNLLLLVLLQLLRNMLNNFINCTKHILTWDKVRARNRLTWNLKAAKKYNVSTNGKSFNRN